MSLNPAHVHPDIHCFPLGSRTLAAYVKKELVHNLGPWPGHPQLSLLYSMDEYFITSKTRFNAVSVDQGFTAQGGAAGVQPADWTNRVRTGQ